MLNNLLIYRFLLVNLLAVLAGVMAFDHGWIQPLYGNDFTYITSIIALLFVACWATTFRRILRGGYELNRIKKEGGWHMPPGAVDKAWAKVAWLRDVSGWLVGLGLLGTIIGFSYALSGVNEVSLGSARGVSDAIGPLMDGMRVALNTTIVGAVFSMWNEINQRILRTAMACMIADCVDTP
jgi:hypothetical protein